MGPLDRHYRWSYCVLTCVSGNLMLLSMKLLTSIIYKLHLYVSFFWLERYLNF